jgi:hypothetical protein
MHKIRSRAALGVVLCTALGAPVSAAETPNLVGNGSFETPGFVHSDWNDNFRYLSGSADTSIDGWSISKLQDVGEPAYWFHSSRYSVWDGEYALAMSDGTRATTQVPLVAGESYTLTFYSYRDLQPEVSDFALRIDAGTATRTMLLADAADTGNGQTPYHDQNWLRYQFTFTAAQGGLQALSIANLPDGITSYDGGVAIDAVSLSPTTAPIPEPTQGLLWVTGLGMVLPWARRRLRGRPWLAGMPAGSTASSGSPGFFDIAPDQSPGDAGIVVAPGAAYKFVVAGAVRHGPSFPFPGPDGGDELTAHLNGAENGIADLADHTAVASRNAASRSG